MRRPRMRRVRISRAGRQRFPSYARSVRCSECVPQVAFGIHAGNGEQMLIFSAWIPFRVVFGIHCGRASPGMRRVIHRERSLVHFWMELHQNTMSPLRKNAPEHVHRCITVSLQRIFAHSITAGFMSALTLSLHYSPALVVTYATSTACLYCYVLLYI